jgi:hypothetical protein
MDVLMRGEIVDVYEVIGESNNIKYSCGFFISEHKANQSVKGSGHIRKHKALMYEEPNNPQWQFYLLQSVVVDTNFDEKAIVENALSKLSKEEKSIFGYFPIDDKHEIITILNKN